MLAHIPQKLPKPTAVDRSTPLPDSPPALLRFDGSCRPNPGPMGIGYVLEYKSRVLVQVGAQIGQGTNNEAEYQALLSGLRHALRLGFWNLDVECDSLLVVKQMHEEWKVKDATLRKLRDEALGLAPLFKSLTIVHIPREENGAADDLSRKIVFEEPDLPPLEPSRTSRYAKVLYEWQAAAVRVWWLKYHPGAGVLSRIFGVAPTMIEQIGLGKSYRDADFSTYSLETYERTEREGGHPTSHVDQPAAVDRELGSRVQEVRRPGNPWATWESLPVGTHDI